MIYSNSIVYGNNVTLRAHVIIKDGQRTWLDPQSLSPGILTKFYMYINYFDISSLSTQIRLQVWRPLNMTDSSRYLLVWQMRVTVYFSNRNGALYVVNNILITNKTFHVWLLLN